MSEKNFPPRCWVEFDYAFGSVHYMTAYSEPNDCAKHEYISLEEHNHLMAHERRIGKESDSLLSAKGKEIAGIRDALEFYANKDNWNASYYEGDHSYEIASVDHEMFEHGTETVHHIGGKLAREVLARAQAGSEGTAG